MWVFVSVLPFTCCQSIDEEGGRIFQEKLPEKKTPVIGHLLLTEICHLEGNHFREASHSDSHNTDVRSLQAKKRQFLVPTFPLVKLRIITLSFQRDSLSPVGALWCRVLNLCQGTGGGRLIRDSAAPNTNSGPLEGTLRGGCQKYGNLMPHMYGTCSVHIKLK